MGVAVAVGVGVGSVWSFELMFPVVLMRTLVDFEFCVVAKLAGRMHAINNVVTTKIVM